MSDIYNAIRPDGAEPEPLGLGGFERDPASDDLRLDNGDVIITIGAGPEEPEEEEDDDFDANLAEILAEKDPQALYRIADDLIQSISADDASRREWLDDRAEAIKLLGFKLEAPDSNVTGVGNGETISRFYADLLKEACLRFQANARGELLPSDGPVKVKNAGEDSAGDGLAEELEGAFNFFLTTTASEYYPDTDRLLFMVGLGGSGFKKVYRCPLRRRPTSESVDAENLIIIATATDLRNAPRITHVVDMPRATLKRLQLLKVYRGEVSLQEPTADERNPAEQVKDDASGLNPSTTRQEDLNYKLWESRCELDIPGFEDEDEDGEPTGLPLPYIVTLDKKSQEVLEIRRNWRKDDPIKKARQAFVKYPYVEAFGLYGIGLFHILGNATRALTAATRMSMDNGMLANFPAYLVDKSAMRQLTNEFRANVGGAIPLDVGERDIRALAAPIPYRDVSPSFMALIEFLQTNSQRVGGTAELQVGEGRQDAPVGTTLALLEQSTKIQDAVHKRLHQAQSEELGLLKELFREDPESFWRNLPGHGNWNEQKLIDALNRCDISPAADPNTPSHMHRIMKGMGLVQLASAHPDILDLRKSIARALQDFHITDADDLFVPPQAPGAQPPDPLAQSKLLDSQAKMATANTKMGELHFKAQNAAADYANQAAQRASDERLAQYRLTQEHLIHSSELKAKDNSEQRQLISDHIHAERDVTQERLKQVGQLTAEELKQRREHQHEAALQYADQQHAAAVEAAKQRHVAAVQAANQDHATVTQRADQVHDVVTQARDQGHERRLAEFEASHRPKGPQQ